MLAKALHLLLLVSHHDPLPHLLSLPTVHGFITEAQFRDILEAEHLNSKSEVANLFRHHFGGRRRHH